MQNTPAAVRVPGAQTLSARPVLLAWLDGNLCNLKTHGRVKVTAQPGKYHKMYTNKSEGMLNTVTRQQIINQAFPFTQKNHSFAELEKHWKNSVLLSVTQRCSSFGIKTMLMFYVNLMCLSALCPHMSACKMSTAQATVAFIVSQRNSSEQLGPVGRRKLFLCHQWAFVCTRASSLCKHTYRQKSGGRQFSQELVQLFWNWKKVSRENVLLLLLL